MAIDFIQNFGFGHVLLFRTFGSQISFPRTLAGWLKVGTTWDAADKNVMMIRANDGDGAICVQLGSVTGHPNQPGATFKAQCQVNDFVFQENGESPALPFYQWVHILAEWQGAGINPTLLTCYGNGVAGAGHVPVIITECTDVYDKVTFGGFKETEDGTNAIHNTCAENWGHWNTLLTAEEKSSLANGALPSSIQPAYLIDHLRMLDEATAGVNSGTSGVDFTLNEVPPTGVINTCVDAPIKHRAVYNRIMG